MKMGISRYPAGILVIFLLFSLMIGACDRGGQTDAASDSDRLRVVATTTFIGDVVGEIGGERIDLVILLKPGQNPHSYLPTPRDMVDVTEANLLFANGFGLEEFLDDLISGADSADRVVIVSEGIDVREVADGEHEHEDENDHGDHDDEESDLGLDPHVWFEPRNLLIWVDNITVALADADPENADYYRTNAAAYREELIALDAWIADQLDDIPEQDRKLVTDHDSLGYFARAYEMEQIGAVIPALTTEAETSGMQLADLINTIQQYHVKAIFVGVDFDPTLAERVSEETGVDLVPLYFGSLTDGEPAGTYLDFMRYNVQSIVEALD